MILLLALLACGAAGPPPAGGVGDSDAATWELRLRGVALAGSPLPHGTVADVAVREGRIHLAGAGEGRATEEVDGAGLWLAPAFIDSHVHLSYAPRAAELAAGGVAAAVDLAAPEAALAALPGSPERGPLRVLASGPMVTAVGGYPTQGWGAAGYGLECADADAASAAVEHLVALGAEVIKLSVTEAPVLDDAALAAAAAAAHGHGMRVASHALSDAQALAAARAGADVLAHTPTAALAEATVAAWSGRAVISTLHAFGGAAARDNLAALRAAGAVVLYGTDFGNTQTAGIDGQELAALAAAGLSGEEILVAGTSAPADWWGLSDLGRIDEGHAASLLLLDADPHQDPQTLTRPLAVWIAGQRQ
ncbi:amidohydrolase family protein [Myxococcota bacterium]|nr:amidohydrolase family protein [Myxococcota bacterium]